jgi:hypothetical protein
MTELKLIVHRNRTDDPNDEAGIQQFHEERARLIHGLIDTLDLDVKGGVYDVAEGGRPREIAEIIIALGTAGVFAAMVQAFKVWIDRKKIVDVEIVGPSGSIKMSGAITEDVVRIAQAVGV